VFYKNRTITSKTVVRNTAGIPDNPTHMVFLRPNWRIPEQSLKYAKTVSL